MSDGNGNETPKIEDATKIEDVVLGEGLVEEITKVISARFGDKLAKRIGDALVNTIAMMDDLIETNEWLCDRITELEIRMGYDLIDDAEVKDPNAEVGKN